MKTKNNHSEKEFPILEKLNKSKTFSTPEGYFESLPGSIMNRINQTKRITPFYTRMGYAASFLIIASISILFFTKEKNESTLGEFGTLTVDEYYEEFSEADLEINESLQFDEMAMN